MKTYPIMAGYKKMISSIGSIPKGVHFSDIVEVAVQIANQVLAAVGAWNVQNLLQYMWTKRQVIEMGFIGIFSDKLLVFLKLLHEPSFRSIYSIKLWLMEYGPFSFIVCVDLQSLLHQFVAPAYESKNHWLKLDLEEVVISNRHFYLKNVGKFL